jgi:hypothetical protein
VKEALEKDEIAWLQYILNCWKGMMKIIVLTFIMKIEQLVTKTENSKRFVKTI